MPPRTIDNLGTDVYTRYAEDQQILDKAGALESKDIYSGAVVDVTTPSYPSQFNLLLGLTLMHPAWADFQPPSEYGEKKKILFSSQILPFLGNDDKKEAQVRRIKEYHPIKVEGFVFLDLIRNFPP